jgi:hypothetical protein
MLLIILNIERHIAGYTNFAKTKNRKQRLECLDLLGKNHKTKQNGQTCRLLSFRVRRNLRRVCSI